MKASQTWGSSIRSHKWNLRAAAFLSVASVAALANAGASAPRTASCTFNSDGSGYCSGTLKAFRNSSNTSAQMILQSYASTTLTSRYIIVIYNGTRKLLNLSSSFPASTLTLFDNATLAVDSNVYVHWNTSTIADTFQFYNDSGLL